MGSLFSMRHASHLKGDAACAQARRRLRDLQWKFGHILCLPLEFMCALDLETDRCYISGLPMDEPTDCGHPLPHRTTSAVYVVVNTNPRYMQCQSIVWFIAPLWILRNYHRLTKLSMEDRQGKVGISSIQGRFIGQVLTWGSPPFFL